MGWSKVTLDPGWGTGGQRPWLNFAPSFSTFNVAQCHNRLMSTKNLNALCSFRLKLSIMHYIGVEIQIFSCVIILVTSVTSSQKIPVSKIFGLYINQVLVAGKLPFFWMSHLLISYILHLRYFLHLFPEVTMATGRTEPTRQSNSLRARWDKPLLLMADLAKSQGWFTVSSRRG